MAENRICGSFPGSGSQKEAVCIDTYRVLDSCRDKDCFENVRVYLTCFGQDIIERTSIIRAKCGKVVWANIDMNDVPFNRGFYQLNARLYVKITFEACLGHGNLQEFDGLAVVEKKVVLYGSEGNVSIFKSEDGGNGFCNVPDPNCGKVDTNLPIGVIETVDPVILGVKVVEPHFPCCCSCCVGDIPTGVVQAVNGELIDYDDHNRLLISLGIFSVIRIERPAQLIVQAAEYSVPEKECVVAEEDDPCTLFKSMAFPINEFSSSIGCPVERPEHHVCGCSNN